MEIASGLSMKLQKITFEEMKWIDNLYQKNQNVFDYRIQGLVINGQGHLSDTQAQSITLSFSGLSDETIKVMTEMKERFESQEDES